MAWSVDFNEGGSFSDYDVDKDAFWPLVDNFGLWLTRRVRVKLMSSGLLLLSDHLLLIGFRSHLPPLTRIIIHDEGSVVLINFLMSHICSGECYISRRIRSFPSPLCACACPVARQTEDGRKMSKKENRAVGAGGISGGLWRQRQRYRVLPLSTQQQQH